MAAIRTKFELALERSRFTDWTVVGITAAYLLTAPSQQLADMPAPPPPNEAGGCWKELPETLAKKKAIWNPQNEDHRCFMWCVLAHCLGVEGLTWQERKRTVSCSGSFFYCEMTRCGRRPVGWQPALADVGVDFSGLPTDRPVGFDDIEAFELRAGRVEVFVFVWQQTLWADGLEYYHVLQQRALSGTGVVQHTVLLLLHSGHYSLTGAGRQAGADPGSHAHQHRRKRGVQVPEVHGPLHREGLLAAAPRLPVLSRDSRAHLESAAVRAREEPAALQGQGLRRARAPDVLRGPQGLQHARPDGPHSAMRLRATRGAEAEAHAPQRDSDKYHAVRAMLNDLLKLADHYLTWRRRPVSMTRREELEHRAATHCRECLTSFETAEKKLHHCHGTGQYLGALCHSCNIAAQTPKTIPVVFHNGGGYDFHFLLRYIDGLSCQQGAARRARRGQRRRGHRERGRRKRAREAHAHGQGRAKGQGQGQGRAKAPHRLVRAIKQGDYSHLCLRVLYKSGEKCLQMSWGPTSSLASMIDDLRACTHKQLPELFPLMASLHPELQLRTPTDSPPQRRPLKQRRTHCELEQAWDCILRKLPMPFEHFCGAEAWEMPAVWEQHCYDSVLAGKAVSAEDHRLAVNTANVMGWETFREFHRRPGPGGRDGELPGLLPGAVGARPHPLRHAARGRLGRHAAALGLRDSHSPHHRRAGLQGRAGLRHGRAELHLPALHSSQQPRAGRGGLQPRGARQLDLVLGLQRHVPGRNDAPMSNGPCVAVALPEDNAARLSWLHETCLSSLTGSPTPRR